MQINTAAVSESMKEEPDGYASFDSQWWDGFLEASADFTETLVIPKVLSDGEVSLLEEMVLSSVAEICRRHTNAYDFRVYINGVNDIPFMDRSVFPYPPEKGEDIGAWSSRVFKKQKFGIIVNYGEKFSGKLAQKLLSYIHPLMEKTGIPMRGLNITIFIGDYGYTPLGIHQDRKGENVIHFHLGPEGKVMYNWDEDLYHELAGGKQNNMEIAPLLPQAKVFPFEKGDIYYMPWNKYHVGLSDELSVGVSLWFNHPKRNTLVNNLFDSLKTQYLNPLKDLLTQPIKEAYGDVGFEFIESCLDFDDHIEQLSFEEVLKEVYCEYKYALFSNSGWRTRPLSLEQETGYDENDYGLFEGKDVMVTPLYKLYYRAFGENNLHVYVRGSKITMRYHEAMIGIIEKLNTGKVFPVEMLLEEISHSWPKEAGLYFLSLLYNKKGIVITEA